MSELLNTLGQFIDLFNEAKAEIQESAPGFMGSLAQAGGNTG